MSADRQLNPALHYIFQCINKAEDITADSMRDWLEDNEHDFSGQRRDLALRLVEFWKEITDDVHLLSTPTPSATGLTAQSPTLSRAAGLLRTTRIVRARPPTSAASPNCTPPGPARPRTLPPSPVQSSSKAQ
ncbi:uncharacterized protein EHS24_009486 [Apiotrichum porosum]|uniref:Uncharacterized protein n=1 Tax=Apiotrichum porosum TaxID=105984 RepID=A0A427XLT0_9TREE|nr:uncharacterized protein EHS24_009486 [Apiotrichum porosum]RSH79826.1 hypothetical protein EHS24_009486 [Apiotrichum porosum]